MRFLVVIIAILLVSIVALNFYRTKPVSESSISEKKAALEMAQFLEKNKDKVFEKIKNPDAKVSISEDPKILDEASDKTYRDEMSRYFNQSEQDEALKDLLVTRHAKKMSDQEVLERVDRSNQVLLRDPEKAMHAIVAALRAVPQEYEAEREVLTEAYVMSMNEAIENEPREEIKKEIFNRASQEVDMSDVDKSF